MWELSFQEGRDVKDPAHRLSIDPDQIFCQCSPSRLFNASRRCDKSAREIPTLEGGDLLYTLITMAEFQAPM